MALKDLYTMVGSRIRELRDLRELTQADIAGITGINRATISNIESGKQQVSLYYLFLIARALKVEVRSFLPEVSELNILPEEHLDILNEKIDEHNLDEVTKNSILRLLMKKPGDDLSNP